MTDRATEIEAIAQRLKCSGFWVSDDRRIREPAAASFLGISTRTLRAWRAEDRAPKFCDVGRLTYRIGDLLAFIQSRTHESGK